MCIHFRKKKLVLGQSPGKKIASYLECLYFGPAMMDVAHHDKDPKRGLSYVASMREPRRDGTGKVIDGEWDSDPRLPLVNYEGYSVDPTTIKVVPFPHDYIAVYAVCTYRWEEKP
jgi:hypothetical protein